MLRTHLNLAPLPIALWPKRFVVAAAGLLICVFAGRAQQVRLPSGKGQYAELSSEGPQSRKGSVFVADKNVDLQYAGMRLRADHIEYDDQTHEATAAGHIQFDYENEHLEADDA